MFYSILNNRNFTKRSIFLEYIALCISGVIKEEYKIIHCIQNASMKKELPDYSYVKFLLFESLLF